MLTLGRTESIVNVAASDAVLARALASVATAKTVCSPFARTALADQSPASPAVADPSDVRSSNSSTVAPGSAVPLNTTFAEPLSPARTAPAAGVVITGAVGTAGAHGASPSAIAAAEMAMT